MQMRDRTKAKLVNFPTNEKKKKKKAFSTYINVLRGEQSFVPAEIGDL